MTQPNTTCYEAIEAAILQRFDAVCEIGVYKDCRELRAVIYPNFPVLTARTILNIREWMRLDVIERYNHHVPPEQRICDCIVVKQPLLKTRQGKIDREMLPGYFTRSSQQQRIAQPEPDCREYQKLKAFLGTLAQREILPDDHFDLDLALSSLDKVRCQVFLETVFGIAPSEKEWSAHCTVQSLAEYLKARTPKNGKELFSSPLRGEAEGRVGDTPKYAIQADWGNMLTSHNGIVLPRSRFPHTLILNIVKTYVRLYFRLEASGGEHLPHSPMILVANHQSFLDGFIIARFLSNEFLRHVFVCATEKHFHTPFHRFVADTSNVIIVNINCRLKESLQKMAAVLQRGENILIFPEGTRTKNGYLGPFKKFFAVLSCELNIPVVPVVIQGAFNAMPTGSVLPKPFTKIHVRFLPPAYPENNDETGLVEKVRQEMLKYMM